MTSRASFPPAASPSENPDYPPNAFVLPAERRLRLWPGIVLIALMWLVSRGMAWVRPGTMEQFMALFLAPMVAAGLITLWWLFFSRLRWWDRLLAPLAFVATAAAASFLYHPTFFGMGSLIIALPVVLTAWVGWLGRLVSQLANPTGGVACRVRGWWGIFTLVGINGIDGSMNVALRWRWSETAEER